MALHAPAFVAPGKATLRQTRRGSTASRDRASVQVRNCGGCTRRELITGVVSGTSLNTAREIEEAVSSKARSAYDQQFARTMEVGMADYELHMRTVKDELFGNLAKFHDPRGTLVEIGMGTGPNMRYYEGLNVVGVEPNEESHSYAHENANRYGVKSLECVRGFGESLPLGDASVDTVVSTLVMCTVDDVERTLAEVEGCSAGRRVPVPRPRGGAPGHAAADDAGGAQPAEQGGVRGVQADARPGGGGESRVRRRQLRRQSVHRGEHRAELAGRDEPGGRGGAVEGNWGWVAAALLARPERVRGCEGVIVVPPVVVIELN